MSKQLAQDSYGFTEFGKLYMFTVNMLYFLINLVQMVKSVETISSSSCWEESALQTGCTLNMKNRQARTRTRDKLALFERNETAQCIVF